MDFRFISEREVYDSYESNYSYEIIWKDFDSNQFHYIYMDYEKETTEELEVKLISPYQLKVKTIFVENNWISESVLYLIDENTIKVKGQNNDGNYEYILKRID